jgi:hypothetical protein
MHVVVRLADGLPLYTIHTKARLAEFYLQINLQGHYAVVRLADGLPLYSLLDEQSQAEDRKIWKAGVRITSATL